MKKPSFRFFNRKPAEKKRNKSGEGHMPMPRKGPILGQPRRVVPRGYELVPKTDGLLKKQVEHHGMKVFTVRPKK